MLLSDYIEQLSLSPQPATKAVDKPSAQVVADVADNVALSTELNAEKQACTPTSSTEHPSSSASAAPTGLSTVTEGSEENVSRKTVFNMADELDEAESPERSELLLTIPPESHSSTDEDGYLVGVSTPAPFARQYSALDNPSRTDRPSNSATNSNSNHAPTAGGDYTIVGVSSVKKPMKKSMNTRMVIIPPTLVDTVTPRIKLTPTVYPTAARTSDFSSTMTVLAPAAAARPSSPTAI